MNTALFIGRFQPFHLGHLSVIHEILAENDHVIIGIGSSEQNFMRENPLTAGERFQLIKAALKEANISAEKYSIIPIPNINNYAIWVNHVNTYVPPYSRLYTGSEIVRACYENKYSMLKNNSDHGPEITQLKRNLKICATEIRQKIINNEPWEKFVPKAVAKLLHSWEIPKRLKTIG